VIALSVPRPRGPRSLLSEAPLPLNHVRALLTAGLVEPDAVTDASVLEKAAGPFGQLQ
jgi:hypothetical protein